VLSLISSEVRSHLAELRGQFHGAQPFRHVVIDGFLLPEFCRQLTAEFPRFDERKALNEFGEVGGKAVFQNLPELGPSYQELDRMLRSREFLAWTGELTGIAHLLYDPDYIGGGTHENRQGQELDPHVDFNYHPRTKLHRRLNLILFLNPEWGEQWGGALELHRNPWLPPEENTISSIVPAQNRCVLFETTERSWHGFTRIRIPDDKKHLSRRSIAVYFYTHERPNEETAPEHSTVYVQRPLPEQIRAGYTLGEEDVQVVRDLLARRDRQIRFLYEREKKFAATISEILGSPTFRLAAAVTWPARKIWRAFRPKG
jgi:Rps23 Pro-64 3,4-dihydroxylase Tpa1-like proline 4-hydroxylase